MKLFLRLMLAVAFALIGSRALAVNSVEVVSRGANPNQTGVEIRIRVTNSDELSVISIPLVIREITPGSYIHNLQMSYGERLPLGPGTPLSLTVASNQFANEDGSCKSGQPGGFYTVTYVDGGPNPVAASPEGLIFARVGGGPLTLPPGTDYFGSFMLTVDVTGTEGTFEIDTTCTNNSNHLLFVRANNTPIVPAFTKGIITIAPGDAPVAQCKDVTLQAVGGCDADVAADSLDDGSYDPDGDPLSFRLIPAGPYSVGVHSVLFEASDGAFTDTCAATITVEDNVPPTITCPGDISVQTDYGGYCYATIPVTFQASDNCGMPTITQIPPRIFFSIGTTTVTGIATDASGNADTCSFNITVTNRPSPVFGFDQDTLEFVAVKRGALPDPQTLTVSNIGNCGDIDFEVLMAYPWLSWNPDTSTTPGTIEFSITNTDTTPDVYWAEVLIMEVDTGGTLAGKSLWVKYTVDPPPASNVTVGSRMAVANSNVTIQVMLSNEIPLKELDIPLVFREIDPGSYITSLTMSSSDRLPETVGAPLTGSILKTTYPLEDGSCPTGSGNGFGTEGTLDFTSPDGLRYHRARLISDPPLYPGSDVTGSLLLHVDVTGTPGSFEVDTTCIDPNSHLLFVDDGTSTAIVPSFTKGIITITTECDCPHQSDLDASGALDALDLNGMINVLFFSAFDPQDPSCPATRSDFDCSGYADALDLNALIEHLFFGGPGPCDQCAP